MLKATSACVVLGIIFLIAAGDSESQVFPSETVVNEESENNEGSVTQKNNVTCGSPPELEEAIAPHLEDTEHAVGTTISYQCNFGYVSRRSDSFLSTCEIDEETGEAAWTTPDISCVSRSCGDPGYVSNGRRIGNLFTFPNKVEFECDEGYKLRGLGARYCQANGEWSGRLPICELVYCSAPPIPVNGRVRYSSLEYGTELRYECNNGFILKNHQPRFCTRNGIWSNDEPECIEARCKMPVSPERGSVQFFGEPKAGSIAVYSCDEGTTFVGASTSKCLSTGDWTFGPPQCLSSCKVTDVKDGEIGQYQSVRVSKYRSETQFVKFQIGESVQHSKTVILLCKFGFIPGNSSMIHKDENSYEVSCNNGHWNKPMQCQVSQCLDSPPSIENGKPVVSSRQHGAGIWYKCKPPYFGKIKSGNVKCEYGTWKGPTPECGDTRCYMDKLNFPGLVKPREQFKKTGESIEINCERGYRKAVWRRIIMCTKGKWDIESSPCAIESCNDEPPQIMNGKIRSFTREHGSMVQYECDEHFEMMSDSTVHCDVRKWEGEPPICRESEEKVEISSETDSGSSPLNVLSSKHSEICSCAYNYTSDTIMATVGGRELRPDERVTKGEVVTLWCLNDGTDILWPSGLRFYSTVNLTCDVCKEWQRHELPSCDPGERGDSLIVYEDKMKILPSGIIEVKEKDNLAIRCISTWSQPQWQTGSTYGIEIVNHRPQRNNFYTSYMNIRNLKREHVGRYDCYNRNHYKTFRSTIVILKLAESEIQCPELQTTTKRGNFTIEYQNDRKVNTEAYYACKERTQKLIGANTRRCLDGGGWSGSFPSCEDITCSKKTTYNGLVVSFTNDNKVNSVARFRCSPHAQLVGNDTSVCQYNGTWSNPWPTCEVLDIRCLPLDGKGIFSIQYSNFRRVNSTAQFFCIEPFQKIDGCNFVTCQQNGEWFGTYPTCIDYISCTTFEEPPGFEVFYTDGVRVGSSATFKCLPPSTLIGAASAICLSNGTWSHPAPICENPKCSLDTLGFTLPEGVVPDVGEVFQEFVPLGTEIPLLCEDNLIHTGSPKAICRQQDRWEFGNVQCVPGCLLRKDSSSLLLIEPLKESYRFGEFIVLSCPPGQTLTSEVQRVMCLGSWSDPLPDCMEIQETSPSSLKGTTI